MKGRARDQYFCDVIYALISKEIFRMLEALKGKVLKSVNASPEYRELFIGLAEEGVAKNLL